MDEKIISNPDENPYSIEVKNFDTDKTKWEIQKGIVEPSKELPLPNELGELKYILEDILAGDSSQFDNEIIKNLNIDNIMAAIEWLAREDNLSESFKDNLLADGWRLNFKAKPPTPAEFLTDKYIGNQAESTFDWARDVFIDFMDPLKPYRTLVLTQHIASGKSTLSTLIQLFISTHYAMMWHPWKYFNLAPSSVFTQCMGAWNQKKASELLVEPFIQILEQSPYFKRVRSHTDLVDAAGEDLAEHICWTTSSPTSVLQLQNGVNYKIINGPGSILGQNIISAVISEMTMFTENGWALDLEESILMADGSTKKMGDIQIGDKLAHPENKENIVLKIPYEKTTTEYEITLDNGKTIKCNSWHIWKVSFRKDKNGNPIYELVTTQFMIDHPELEFDIPEIDEKMLKSFHSVLTN